MLAKRRETNNEIVHEAARAMKEAGLGIKAATITPEGKDDVGSPNRILREEVDGKVIIRTGRRIPGAVGPVAGVHYPISVVRMAVGDAYGAEQWREGEAGALDEVALRTERITRDVCRAVAEFSFRAAGRAGARVYGGPKWTVSPVYEGMLKEEMDAAAERHPSVHYQPVLIDALYAVDELSGFIMACAYVRPTGIHGLTPKSVKKKMKTPAFAAAVNRDELREGAEKLGVDFDEHLAFVIAALEEQADELGVDFDEHVAFVISALEARSGELGLDGKARV